VAAHPRIIASGPSRRHQQQRSGRVAHLSDPDTADGPSLPHARGPSRAPRRL